MISNFLPSPLFPKQQFHIFIPAPKSGTNQIRIASSSGHSLYLPRTHNYAHSCAFPDVTTEEMSLCPSTCILDPRHFSFTGACSCSYPLSLLHREFLPSLDHFSYISPHHNSFFISFELVVSGLHFPLQQKFLKELSIQAIAISSFSLYPQFTPVGFPSPSCHYCSSHKSPMTYTSC